MYKYLVVIYILRRFNYNETIEKYWIYQRTLILVIRDSVICKKWFVWETERVNWSEHLIDI